MDKKTRWITQTAAFTALLIVLQFITAQLGNQFVTGSIVNLLLIVATLTCGFASATTVACVAPVFVRFIGIGPPFWPLVPFIILGNMTLVAVWYLLGRRGNKKIMYPLALVVAAVCKFVVLYLGVVKFAAPVLLSLPPSSPILLAYSFPQLITAAIGGVIAIAILPLLKISFSP
jgi:hypothetical protein